MDEIDSKGRLRHDLPLPGFLRWFLIVCGLFAIVVPTWELYRGVWPLNFASPFFLFIILGAYSVGIPFVHAGIFAPAARWIVRRGRIDILLRNPIFLKRHRITPADVAGFDVVENDWSDGPSTWSVVMSTRAGDKFSTRNFGTKATADMFRQRIETLFKG